MKEILSKHFAGIRLTEFAISNSVARISYFFTEHHPVFGGLILTSGNMIAFPVDPAAEKLLGQKMLPELKLIICKDADDLKLTLSYQDPVRSFALLYVNGMDLIALRKAI